MSMEHLGSFMRSGMAARTDLQTPEYGAIFRLLEEVQGEFLAHETEFRSPEYRWPRDPLHNWSRVWEYPYAYGHLRRYHEEWRGAEQPLVVDLGSGVTFFPFAVARLGYPVLCLDVDPVCETDLRRAVEIVPQGAGRVEVALMEDGRLPMANESTDAVYCISVLEHIPDFGKTIAEVARVLRPGLFILTVDIGMCGWLEIGAERYYAMRPALEHEFQMVYPEVMPHPQDFIMQNEPLAGWRGVLRLAKFRVRQDLRRLRGRTPYQHYPNLGVWGAVMERSG